jgi:hypothetical protein
LSPEELSLHDFLVEQIQSLQLVVEAKDDAPVFSHASIASSQVPESPHPEVKDECLTSEVMFHIAFEVTSQLDKEEESRWLMPEELSPRGFLVEQIMSL